MVQVRSGHPRRNARVYKAAAADVAKGHLHCPGYRIEIRLPVQRGQGLRRHSGSDKGLRWAPRLPGLPAPPGSGTPSRVITGCLDAGPGHPPLPVVPFPGLPSPEPPAPAYRLPASAAGARFSVRVTGSKTGYSTLSRTSAATTAVAKGSLAGPAPRITGTTKVGYVLTAFAGAWSPAPVSLRYQWYRSGVAVAGAAGASYRLPSGAAGATYTVRVTGSKTGYNTLARTSAATARIAAAYVPPAPAAYYANCTAVRNAGKAPLYRGQPGYRSALDRDSDGIACE